jgi:hypothetical protein
MIKRPKSVNSILEKVRQGKLGEVEDLSFSRFTPRVQYKQKHEIIKPYIHYLDEISLRRAVDKFIETPQSHVAIQELAKKHNKKIKSPDNLTKEMMEIYEKFPKEVINDIYNMNYTDIGKLRFEDRSEKNKFRYKMIEKSVDPVTKIITRNDNMKSMIYTRSMIQYILMTLAMLQQEDKQAFDDLMKNLKGGGVPMPGQGGDEEGDQSEDGSQNDGNGNGNGEDQDPNQNQPQPNNNGGSPDQGGNNKNQGNQTGGKKAGKGDKNPGNLGKHLDDLMKKFDETKGSKEILDKVMEDAKKTSEMIDNTMNQDEINKLWDDLNDRSETGRSEKQVEEALKMLDPIHLAKIADELRSVKFSMGSVKEKIKKILDRSVSYFSSRTETYFENIIDAGSFDGFQDYELLHRGFKNAFIEDMYVKETKSVGKIDIYVDVSGSMDSSSGSVDGSGDYISCLKFAKALAFKMKEMDLLNDVYSFQEHVKYEGQSTQAILRMHGGGGTNITNVVNRIRKNGRNAIVITDAGDHLSEYEEKAFFIGVNGSNFRGFNKQYMEMNQVIMFDGERVYKIGMDGRPIE